MTLDVEDDGPPARKKRTPLVTPDQAVRAAYQLVAEEGPSGLSMRKLAASLHVSLPTVYTAIRSKDHLIGDIQDLIFTEISGAMDRDLHLDPEAQLRAMGRALFTWAEANPRLADFLLAEEASADTGRRAAASAPEPGREAVLALLDGLIGPEATAALDPSTSVRFATTISRALLSMARADPRPGDDVWLDIWCGTITAGLRLLAAAPHARAGSGQAADRG